ncbi:MAG: hypothetical protein NTX59_11830 [Elusimicrobia bacterium]|nr:hypothetical protein [Elusimicrobiota bacterium]
MSHIFLIIYNLLTPLIALGYLVFFIFSPRRRLLKNFFAELKERLSVSLNLQPSAADSAMGPRQASVTAFSLRPSPIWVHAASVGEVKALVKLIPDLRALVPNCEIIITASSWSGREEALKLSANVRLAPLDFYPLTRAFIKKTAPRALIIVETEIWPNMLFCAGKAGVPVFMINARVSKKTLALYRAFAPLTRLIFSGIKRVLAQSPWDAEKLSLLPGLYGKVIETGNLKHDLIGASPSGSAEVSGFIKASLWEGTPVITAGSTHPEEEHVIIDAWLEAKKKIPALKLIIVPRHTERLAETEAIARSRSVAFVRWSAGPAPLAQEAGTTTSPGTAHADRLFQRGGADCLLVDAMGLLQAFYAVSTVCFVGGTLDNTGGHNLLEPALFSKPVLFGPNYKNAKLAGAALLKFKGGFMVRDAAELGARLNMLLGDPAFLKDAGENSLKSLRSLQGATEKTLAAISPFLK